jgi:two-component system, sensor histidine kinase and response regulator
VVADGREAVEAATREEWDLILMDLSMPEMDGIEATRAIRALPSPRSEVPIVALTANALSEDRERCFAAGMNDYLSKPVAAADLAAVLGRWVKGVRTESLPTGVEPAAGDEVLDPTVLANLRELGDEFVAELAQLFLDDSPARVKALERSVAAGDGEGIRSHAHGLKGSAGNVGALQLREAAHVLESTGAENALDRAPEELAALQREYRRAERALQDLIAGKPTHA